MSEIEDVWRKGTVEWIPRADAAYARYAYPDSVMSRAGWAVNPARMRDG